MQSRCNLDATQMQCRCNLRKTKLNFDMSLAQLQPQLVFVFFGISFVFLKCFEQSGEAFPETFVDVSGLSETIEHTSRGGLIDFQYF